MTENKDILKKIKKIAKQDQKRRKDPRYIRTMAFLTAKGFLFANTKFPHTPNDRLNIEDAVWAGHALEPRILEVLPAAVLRLPKHFDFDPLRHADLAKVLEAIEGRRKDGPRFEGVPYKKVLAWVNFELKDGRVKTLRERRVPKTFRLRPEIIEKLENLALRNQKAITTIIEDLVQKS